MFDFSESLNIIEKNLDEAIGAYFVYDNIMQNAVLDELFLQKLNQNKYFWRYIFCSLQTTYFMCLGRIFDNKSKFLSINAFLNECTRNINLFSKTELMKRKADNFSSKNDLQNYIDNAYEPNLADFKNLKNIIKAYNKEYEDNYRDIRHTVFAHTEITKKDELEKLFSKTSRDKLEEILMVLKHILIGLFGLYHNGHKIELTNNIYQNGFSVFKKIKEESKDVLKSLNAL